MKQIEIPNDWKEKLINKNCGGRHLTKMNLGENIHRTTIKSLITKIFGP